MRRTLNLFDCANRLMNHGYQILSFCQSEVVLSFYQSEVVTAMVIYYLVLVIRLIGDDYDFKEMKFTEFRLKLVSLIMLMIMLNGIIF